MNEERKIPTAGKLVFGKDGSQLGRVKRIEGDKFQIDTPLIADIWVNFDDIEAILDGTVLLKRTRGDLSVSKRVGFGHSGMPVDNAPNT